MRDGRKHPLQQAPDVGAVLAQAVRDVDLGVLVAREGGDHPRQRIASHKALPLVPVQEVATLATAAEEEDAGAVAKSCRM